MGLDQYLWGVKTLAPQEYDHETKEFKDNPKYNGVLQALDEEPRDIGGFGWFMGLVPVKVWRKANAIHGWFVDNCQDGVDDCRYATVTSDQLKTLCQQIKECIKTKTSDGLKPMQGFFFGTTEIDEYYWEDLADTLVSIEPLLEEYETFFYSSSW